MGRILPLMLILLAPANVWAADARVDFVLITDPGFPITGARKWLDALRRVQISNVQIRKARGGEDLKVEKRGTAMFPSYRVTGALTAKNTMIVPGKEFRLSDGKQIRAWVDRLSRDGLAELGSPRKAFGLTAKQLLSVHEELSRPIGFSTTQMTRADALERIAGPLGVRLDPSVRKTRDGKPLDEEYKGLSSGTSLALLLRPLGAGLTVARTTRGYQLLAIDSSKAKESWPAGWPLEEQKPRDVAPQLFKFTEDVDVKGVPVKTLIKALQPRLEAPVFYDHNALAALDIDPANIKATLPPGRSFYKKILDRALTPALLKMEVKLDENDKPFFWITSIRDPFKPRTR